MASCQTSPRIEFVHEVPDVVFPTFPPPDSVSLDAESETVFMPLWYWQAIAEYKIDVDAIETYFDQLRQAETISKTDKTGGMSKLAEKTRQKVDGGAD